MNQRPTNTILKGDSPHGESAYSGLIPEPQENIYNYIQLEKQIEIPKEFNGKEVWKSFLNPAMDQKQCGSCWAFAAVSALNDRFNIHSLGRLKLNLSPVPIVLCDTHGAANPEPLNYLEYSVRFYEKIQKLYGCNGNLVSEAWRMLYTVGTNSESCMPLDILKYKSPSSCIKLMGPTGDMCSNYQFNSQTHIEYGTPAKFYTASHVYAVPGTGKYSELDICRDIYKFGPVSTAMELYADLYTFDPKSGIYQTDYIGGRISGHAVVLVGWGEENGIKYWWVRNTWGSYWGIDGYFKMIRGTNHCKIEENVIAGLPNLVSSQFVISSDIGIPKVEQNEQQKFFVHSYENIAGGIDPETGYSRRITSYLTYKNLLTDLKSNTIPTPDYNTFIAGEINQNIQNVPQQKGFKIFTDSKYLIFGLLITLLIIVIIGWYYFNIFRFNSKS